jgi:hypothetical protein
LLRRRLARRSLRLRGTLHPLLHPPLALAGPGGSGCRCGARRVPLRRGLRLRSRQVVESVTSLTFTRDRERGQTLCVQGYRSAELGRSRFDLLATCARAW